MEHSTRTFSPIYEAFDWIFRKGEGEKESGREGRREKKGEGRRRESASPLKNVPFLVFQEMDSAIS